VKISEIMVKDIVTLRSSDTIKDAFEKFSEHNISGCPVIDEGNEVVGMFTEADLLGSLKTHDREVRMLYPPHIPIGISFIETKKQKKVLSALRDVGNMEIGEVMKTSVITVTPEDSIEHALQLMVKNEINRVPVIRNKKLVGIVTRGDLIKGIYKQTASSTP
jgi:CBS domain-containing protein